jgi:hypothetical protein
MRALRLVAESNWDRALSGIASKRVACCFELSQSAHIRSSWQVRARDCRIIYPREAGIRSPIG